MARGPKLDPSRLLLTEALFLFSEFKHTSYTLPPSKLTCADFQISSFSVPALFPIKCSTIAAQKQKDAVPSKTKC